MALPTKHFAYLTLWAHFTCKGIFVRTMKNWWSNSGEIGFQLYAPLTLFSHDGGELLPPLLIPRFWPPFSYRLENSKSLFVLQVMEEAPPPPPIFNLPPPPRPPDLPCPLEDQQQARPLHHQSSTLPVVKDLFQESCDINYVIDSRLYLGENLFTLLIVLVCSCILVGIVMTIGLLIYRYYLGQNCLF